MALHDGASNGGVEIDNGVTTWAATRELEEARGGDVRKLEEDDDEEATLFKGTGGDATADLAEGEIAGDGNGEDLGDDDGDWAMVKLSNSASKRINTMVWEAIVERWQISISNKVISTFRTSLWMSSVSLKPSQVIAAHFPKKKVIATPAVSSL